MNIVPVALTEVNLPCLLSEQRLVAIASLLASTEFSSKAQIFNDYFLIQCMPLNTGSTVPLESTLSDTQLSDICIANSKILRFIGSLNANKLHGWDGISV